VGYKIVELSKMYQIDQSEWVTVAFNLYIVVWLGRGLYELIILDIVNKYRF